MKMNEIEIADAECEMWFEAIYAAADGVHGNERATLHFYMDWAWSLKAA